ncbi:hypothetical protein RUM44_002407 [Polyplax serrata]|uniref:Major facilitator superfamily (MFS) profile domain-containing protein n=1 Tax=Polyplax serrata TaxID=468196 RepID=A0ABR1AEN7_POLSC
MLIKGVYGYWFNYYDLRKDITVFVYIHNPENNLEVLETLPLSECQPRCLVTASRKSVCINLNQEVQYDPKLTFWIYLVIRVFIGIIGCFLWLKAVDPFCVTGSTSYAMYEVAVIAILREQKADYGLQRIYASIGGMISSPLSGMLIDYASQGKGYTDFRPAFYLYAGLKMSTSILMLFMNLEFKKAATNVISDAIQVLKNLEVIALLVVCFVLGTAWGYIESFLFWFLEDLGGTRSLMGITITVGGIAGIPLLVLSGPIIDKIGHANVLFIGFLFYAIRLVGYSVIYNPYHCLFFEAMESITSSLAITAAVTYAAKLSTTTTDGSIQGLVGGLYFGVGRGAGSLIGGYLMKAFGTRQTYRIFAVFSVIVGFLYYFFNQFYITKRPQIEGNDICKESKPVKQVNPNPPTIPEKLRDGEKGCETTAEQEKHVAGGESDKKKNCQRIESESHHNPAYVPDNDEEKKAE